MKHLLFALALIFSFAGASALTAQEKAFNFTLNDVNGKPHSLSDYASSKAIVVMFIATQCPISNDYNSRMEALYRDYQEKGFAFLSINSNKQEDVKEIIGHAKKHGLTFTILKDHRNEVADKYQAQVTPEIFVISPSLDILYHGRIDNSRDEENVKTTDLRNALDEILAGKKVTVAKTKAFGCTIKRVS